MGVSRRRGSVLLEGAFALGITSLACLAPLELIRRQWVDQALQHGAFVAVRSGLWSSPVQAKKHVHAFWETALGKTAARRLSARTRFDFQTDRDGHMVRLHTRFAGLQRFPFQGGQKHHFEVTRRCRFPF